ncbi:MAG: oligoribonuclease [Gammaproteobacteria bacterium]|nr:oligoribonuclease [Gammaproteobacteria bacterium]
MSKQSDNLVWIDLEMTGLDPLSDYVIEIATLVTDRYLNILAEGPVLALHQPDEVMQAMDEWNTTQHGKSGLTERVRTSDINESLAEKKTIEFLQDFVAAGDSPMCGNSICQDRRFLARWMPGLERFFHYRNLDVSTLKELARRWAPDVAAGFKKDSSHLAMDDIRDSVRELQYYRQHLFAPHVVHASPAR